MTRARFFLISLLLAPIIAQAADSNELVKEDGFNSWCNDQMKVVCPFEKQKAGPNGRMSYRISIGQVGHYEFQYTGLKMQKGKKYALSFQARGDRGQEPLVFIQLRAKPYNQLSKEQFKPKLGTNWQSYAYVFEAAADEEKNAGLMFHLGAAPGVYEFSALSLKMKTD